uniref:non-specific serine/threonine protein kinase n=1 Tax=Thermosporothrix sp. COM3 TaxID=2490863 RepID=A0A455SSJ6_9CHLR|nr:hypothetical protein KTC_60880 [Thermosporothrix sp. COM3]
MIHDSDEIQQTNRVFGRYQVIRRIGRGGMADVWLCKDPFLQRQVAIKTLPPHQPGNTTFSHIFKKEAQAAAALNHPHIVSVHDFGEQTLADGRIVTYIVMPYIAGGALSDLLEALKQEEKLLPTATVLTYLSQAAQAIDYAHQQGLVHRDIKPGNMLLRDKNWLLLTDFGIAYLLEASLEESATKQQTGIGFGTPDYIAPEQARGQAVPASDIYSLAVVAYQLFTGRLPFVAETTYATIMQHITQQPPLPSQFNALISPGLEKVLLQGMAKQPGERPATAEEFVQNIKQAVALIPDEVTINHPLTAETTAKPSKLALSRRQLLIGGGIAGAAVLAGGVTGWQLLTQTMHLPPSPGPTPQPTVDPAAPTIQQKFLHVSDIFSLDWSADGRYIATAGTEGVLKVWEAQTLLQADRHDPAPIATKNVFTMDFQIAWSPDGKWLALSQRGSPSNKEDISLMTYGIYTPALREAPDFGSPVEFHAPTKAMTLKTDAFVWQGKYLVGISTLDNDITNSRETLFVAETNRSRHTWGNIPVTGGYISALSSSFPTVACSSVSKDPLLAIARNQDIGIGQFRLDSAKKPQWQQRFSLKDPEQGYNGDWDSVSFTPDGKWLAGNYILVEPTILIWGLPDTKVKYRLYSKKDDKLISIALCPDSRKTLIAACTQRGKVLVWDFTKSKQQPLTLHPEFEKSPRTLTWSPDGKWLAVTYKNDKNSSIFFWKIEGRGI